jgi:hypothetical protein
MNVLQANFMLTPFVSAAIFAHSFLKDGLPIFLITHPLKDHSVAVRLRTFALNAYSLLLSFSLLRSGMHHIRYSVIYTYELLGRKRPSFRKD